MFTICLEIHSLTLSRLYPFNWYRFLSKSYLCYRKPRLRWRLQWHNSNATASRGSAATCFRCGW